MHLLSNNIQSIATVAYKTGIRLAFSLIFLVFTFATTHSQNWKQYPYEPEGSVFSFPSDEGPHPVEDIEWWSITGNVKGMESGTNYSFSLTYYIYPYNGYDGMRILNLSNDDTGEFYTDSKFLGYQGINTEILNIKAYIYEEERWEFWKNRKDAEDNIIPFEYEIKAANSHGTINLECTSLKAPVPIAGSGQFDVGSESYTNCYSQTMNSITGTLHFMEVEEAVEGTAWIDHQYGGFNMITSEKYEWFSVQLSNEMEINIWNVFTPKNQLPEHPNYKHMTIVDESGGYVTTNDFNLEQVGYDFSKDNTLCYAQKWHLTSPLHQLDVMIVALHTDCEIHSPYRFYKGATYIDGTVEGIHYSGKGFAELLKTYENPKLEMNSPVDINWDVSTPISWHLQNLDDGRTLLYDLEYRYEATTDFKLVESGITDTLFLWENPPLETGDNIWVRVKGYTSDNTLSAYSPIAFYSPENLDPTVSIYPRKQETSLFKLYPIPSREILNIAFQKEIGSYQYQILDVTGKLIFQSEKSLTGKGRSLFIGDMIPGTYILRIQAESEDTSVSFQVQ